MEATLRAKAFAALVACWQQRSASDSRVRWLGPTPLLDSLVPGHVTRGAFSPGISGWTIGLGQKRVHHGARAWSGSEVLPAATLPLCAALSTDSSQSENSRECFPSLCLQ